MVDFTKIKKYNEEIRKLIEERPELQALQDEVHRELKKAGSNKVNRLSIISSMMVKSYEELLKELINLKEKI